jgi:Galactoside-binding lectin
MVSPNPLTGSPLNDFQFSKTTCNLKLGDVQPLSRPLAVDDVVHFYASTVSLTPDPNGDDTSLNLLTDDQDYLLRISIHRDTRTIALNSRYATGDWGADEHIKWDDIFTEGQPATVSIRNDSKTFTISINDEARWLYKKRINLPTQAVSYQKNAAMTTAIFGPAIAAQLNDANPPPDYESAYFQLTIADVEEESEENPFDIVVIGSGIGGGALANALREKNRQLLESAFNAKSTPERADPHSSLPPPIHTFPPFRTPPQPLRILVIERGHLIFHTHCLNGPRPSISGTTSQGNDLFFNTFKHQWDTDEETKKVWVGGGVYCLGGRGAVWGLFTPR